MLKLDDIIRDRFPADLRDEEAFEEFYDELLADVRGPAMKVVAALERRLREETDRAENDEQLERDRWHLFGEVRPLKSASSCRSKLARKIEKDEGDLASESRRLTRVEIGELLLGFSDLSRCRVVCALNQDVTHLLKALITDDGFLGSYPVSKVKDFVFGPERRGVLLGHRARQFSASVRIGPDDTCFRFEVQLMTLLQHAWDRRNHPLYEWTRRGGKLPDELRVNDFACAEALHLVDQQGEQNWKHFLAVREEK